MLFTKSDEHAEGLQNKGDFFPFKQRLKKGLNLAIGSLNVLKPSKSRFVTVPKTYSIRNMRTLHFQEFFVETQAAEKKTP